MTWVNKEQSTEMLIDLLRRSPLLEELQGGPLDRREVRDRLKISRTTSYRYCRLLEEVGAIEKTDDVYRLTDSGILLTESLVRFKREADAALELTPVLEAIQDAPVDIDLREFGDAIVTSAEHGDPYAPVARFLSLVEETETLRGIDLDIIAPLYIDEIQQPIINGMKTETIAISEATEYILDSYPEKCYDACVSGHLTVKLHDNLPFGLVIFDHRVGIGVPKPGSRTLSAFADTDSPHVRQWAEAVYETYESDAKLLEEFTQQGFSEALGSDGLT